MGWWIVGNLRFPCVASPSNPATLTDRGIIAAVASLWQTIASGAFFFVAESPEEHAGRIVRDDESDHAGCMSGKGT